MTSEDYVCIEVAFYGPDRAKVKLATDDFSIRINGKKQASPSAPFGMMMRSLKDPEWQPEVAEGPKSKGGGISTGGGGGGRRVTRNRSRRRCHSRYGGRWSKKC